MNLPQGIFYKVGRIFQSYCIDQTSCSQAQKSYGFHKIQLRKAHIYLGLRQRALKISKALSGRTLFS